MAKSVLLHVCCGPCAIIPMRELMAEGFAVNGYFFNPNIAPLSEYLRRREGALAVAAKIGLGLGFCREEYEPRLFLRAVAGREDERCQTCYALRLEQTARAASVLGADSFSSSLLYSKYQKHEAIIQAAEFAAKKHGVKFLYRDFRGGWQEGIELSKAWEIYRQPYCGCVYSEFERYQAKLARAQKDSLFFA